MKNSNQKQTIFKCSLLGIDSKTRKNVFEDLSEHLSDFQYSVLHVEDDTTLKYNIEFILTDNTFFNLIREIYQDFYIEAQTEDQTTLLPSFPKLMIQWGYQSGKKEHLSSIHIAQISDISYKFKNNREKIVQVQAVDLNGFASKYLTDKEQHVPIFDSIGLTFPGDIEDLIVESQNIDNFNKLLNQGVPILYRTEGNERVLLKFTDVVTALAASMTDLIGETYALFPHKTGDAAALEEIEDFYQGAYSSYVLSYLNGRDVGTSFDLEKLVDPEAGEKIARLWKYSKPDKIWAATAQATKNFFKVYFNIDIDVQNKNKRYDKSYYYDSTWSKENLGVYGNLPLGPKTLSRLDIDKFDKMKPQVELPPSKNLAVDFHAMTNSVNDLIGESLGGHLLLPNIPNFQGLDAEDSRNQGRTRRHHQDLWKTFTGIVQNENFRKNNIITLDPVDTGLNLFANINNFPDLDENTWYNFLVQTIGDFGQEYNEMDELFTNFKSDALKFNRMDRVRLRNGVLDISPTDEDRLLNSNAKGQGSSRRQKRLAEFIPNVKRFRFKFPGYPIFVNNVNIIEGYEGRRFDIIMPSKEELQFYLGTQSYKPVTFKMPIEFDVTTKIVSFDNSIETDLFSSLGDLDEDIFPPVFTSTSNNIFSRVNNIDKTETFVNTEAQKSIDEASTKLISVNVDSGVIPKHFDDLETEEKLEIRYSDMRAKLVVPENTNFFKAIKQIVKRHNDLFSDPKHHFNFRVYNTRKTVNQSLALGSKMYLQNNFADVSSVMAGSTTAPKAHIVEFSLNRKLKSSQVNTYHFLKDVNSFNIHDEIVRHNIKSVKTDRHVTSDEEEWRLHNTYKPVEFQYGAQDSTNIDDIVTFLEFNGDLRMLANVGGGVRIIDDVKKLSADLNSESLRDVLFTFMGEILNSEKLLDSGTLSVKEYIAKVKGPEKKEYVEEMFKTLEALRISLSPEYAPEEGVQIDDTFFETLAEAPSFFASMDPVSRPTDMDANIFGYLGTKDFNNALKVLSFLANRQVFNSIFSVTTDYSTGIQQLQPGEEDNPTLINTPSVTSFKMRQNNPFGNTTSDTGSLSNILKLVGAEYFLNSNTPWEVKIKTLGIPELDGIEEIFEKRLVNLKVKDLSREYKAKAKATHFLSGAYTIIGLKHNMNSRGYTSEFTLLKRSGGIT